MDYWCLKISKLTKNPSPSFRLDPALRDYAVLKARVHEVLVLGRKRIEKEFLLMRYQTGLLINEHVRLNGGRAVYGAKAVSKLEKDFDIDQTELNRYAQFTQAYPIDGRGRQLHFNLPWKHYRKLMIIHDDDRRWDLTLQAEEEEWDFEKIESRVRHAIGNSPSKKDASRLPLVCLGPFYTYKIIRPGILHPGAAEWLVDFGFGQTCELEALTEKRFAVETLVASVKDARGRYRLEKIPLTLPSPQGGEGQGEGDILYTYKAYVENVLDADTLKLQFELGFGQRRRETIRLNHIDCPELSTPEGRAAKRFVEAELAGCEFITVKSVKTRKEKWGRYLGDVFYQKKGSAAPVYLNQLLLDKGHAVRVRS